MKKLITTFILLSHSLLYAGTLCEESIKILENPANVAKERSLAMTSLELCKKEKVINPHMALANVEISEGKYQAAIKWSEDALKIIPGLALPYLNICAAWHGLKQYDKAIESCKKGLSFKWIWADHLKALLNANLALSIFTKGANEGNMDIIMESEKYFSESMKLDPKLGQNYFYLGKIEAVNRSNHQAALTYYKKGCELKHRPSCDSIKEAEEAVKTAAAPSPSVQEPAPAVIVPTTPAEVQIYAKLSEAYAKKGIPPEKVKEIIASLKTSMATIPVEQRLMSLNSMLKAIQ